MQNRNWIRLSLASSLFLAAGVAGLSMGGCDDGGTTNTDGGVPKDGTAPLPDSAQQGDTGPQPGTDGGDSGPTAAAPKISLVHAAAGLPVPVRFCMSVGGGFPLPDQLPLEKDVPTGIPFGSGGALSIDQARAKLIATTPIQPVAIAVNDASKGKTCPQLFQADAGPFKPADGVVAVVFPVVPAGTIQLGKSYVIAALGCPGNFTPPAQGAAYVCGADFATADAGSSSFGNIRLELFELDKAAAPAADEVGVQFVHLSPQMTGVVASLQRSTDGGVAVDGKLLPAFSTKEDAGTDDAGTPQTVIKATLITTTGVGYESKPIALPSTVMKSKDVAARLSGGGWINAYFPVNTTIPALAPLGISDYGGSNGGPGIFAAAGASGRALGGGTPAEILATHAALAAGVSLQNIAIATTGRLDAGVTDVIQAGKSYTFVAVGDPAIQAAPGNTGFRIIALANDP